MLLGSKSMQLLASQRQRPSMEISKIAIQDIHRIKPLWEALNRHHREHSTHFKAHFKAFTFGKRRP